MLALEPSFVALTTDGHRYLFNVLAARRDVRYDWDFGDPASGSSNRARGTEALHRYSENGIYTVRLTAGDPDGGGTVTVQRHLTVVG